MPGAFNPEHSPKFFITHLPEITNTPSRDKFHFTFLPHEPLEAFINGTATINVISINKNFLIELQIVFLNLLRKRFN